MAAGPWTLAPSDPGYPAPLAELGEEPAPALHGTGARRVIEELSHEPAVTLVGSRRASAYGLRVAESLARELALAGVTTVSGMALGIDAAAHRGSLAAGGATVAVLGCGPDVIYPSLHRDLYRRIAGGGAVISEHPPGTAPRKHFFPARNRIMAALGRVVVIVEAALPSGSLITAEVAARLGRTVGAVPGQVGSRNAEGTNSLLKEGAEPIRGAQDVLDLLFGVGHPGPGRVRAPLLEPPLDAVLELVREGVTTLDRLVAAAQLSPRAAAVALSRLELLGLVQADALGGYTPTVGDSP
jgi:DNA processing protein